MAVTAAVIGFGLIAFFIVVVGAVAFIVQRKFGSKWLLVVWLAPGAIIAGFFLTQVDYNVHSFWSRPVLLFGASQFVLWNVLAGEVVWLTGVWFGPRRPLTAANGIPAGLLEDAHGLAGILGRYQKLLVTSGRALDTADPNPYPSLLQAFGRAFRQFLPSATRQGMERTRQMGPVPNILAIDLTGAETVLAELEQLTPAQLSAIEACHHTNVRRLRQRSSVGWRFLSKLGVLIGVISSLVLAAEHVGVLKFKDKDIDLWPLISGITMMGVDMPSIIARAVGGFVIVLMLFIAASSRFLPILQRLEAFEDILTIAKAYRKGASETTNPSGEPSLTVTY